MLYYVTGNKDKVKRAHFHLDPNNIPFEQKELNFVEIQSDNIEAIAEGKAKQAFEVLHSPLIVNDGGWYIPALNGFPGAYMRYINQWFTPQNFLSLLEPYENRDIILRNVICYIDHSTLKIFSKDIKGTILKKAKGTGIPSECVISFTHDNKSIAEFRNEGKVPPVDSNWPNFIDWYKNYLRS